MDGLDKQYDLAVTVGSGSLAVDAVLANLTRGRGVIWSRKNGAQRWDRLALLPQNQNAIFDIGSADLYRGGQILLVFEMIDDAEIGSRSRYEAIGELLLDGTPVDGSKQRIRGTFDDDTRIEGILWSVS
jgi:hypothetical protein